MSRIKHNIDNVFQLIDGHIQFLDRNTGLTVNPTVQHYVLNPQFVLANNRQFTNWTAQEGTPNGASSTEGQAVLILGCVYAYLASGDAKYLDSATQYWQAYINYFFGGQPIPDPPLPYRPNYVVNGKEPRLAHYPLSTDGYPSHGGFKGVALTWTNGRTVIPHGAPNWGEYLDKAWYAFSGVLGWDAVNATVYGLHADGTPNWDVLGDQWDVDWIIDRLGRKVGSTGTIIQEGYPESEWGTVQLKNTNLTGAYKFNYATCNPVDKGGYLMERNTMWLNAPVNVPVPVGFIDNTADAEMMWCDANYLMYQITRERKYWLCWQSSLLVINGYSDIDQFDKFFRQSTFAVTPFTDGVVTDYNTPSTAVPKYSRDSLGLITIRQDIAAQVTLEQQGIWFRVDQTSKLRMQFQGLDDFADEVLFSAELDLSKTKSNADIVTYRCGLPPGTSNMQSKDIPLASLMRLTPVGGGTYIVANPQNVVDWGDDTVVQFKYTTGILDKNSDQITTVSTDENGGLTLNFTSTTLQSVTYRSYTDDFNVIIMDAQGWRWQALLPKTNGIWTNKALTSANFQLSTYQPNHSDTDPKPTTVSLTAVNKVDFVLNTAPVNAFSGTLDLYCVNAMPELYSSTSGDDYTMNFRIVISGSNPHTVKIGDCTIVNYKPSSLNYTLGVVPFSTVTDPKMATIDGERGLPYPGYQYPTVYCFNGRAIDWTRLNNSISFLADAQHWFSTAFAPLLPGPMAQAYVWNRHDALQYGTPDTFTMEQWNKKAWDGYEARAFYNACRTVYELVQRGETPPTNLVTVCKNWIDYLKWFQDSNDGRTPTIFNTDGTVLAPMGNFSGDMTALFMAGCVTMGLAGFDAQIPNIGIVADRCFLALQNNYLVISPNNIMNGAWSNDPQLGTDNGVFIGFHAGEILRGLGLYALYYKLNPQNALPALDNSNIPVLTILTASSISVDVTD